MALPDKDAYATLGGEKRDYQPAEDPSTDLAAEASDETRADVAETTRMVGRCYVGFTVSGGVCTVVEHDAVWGSDPAVKPTVIRGAQGQYNITWPSTVTDARGHTHALNLRRGMASNDGGAGGNVGIPFLTRTGPNTARVDLWVPSEADFDDPDPPSTVLVCLMW